MKGFLKKVYLYLNDATIGTRFFFDGEYKRWCRQKNIFATTDGGAQSWGTKIRFLIPGTGISGGIAVIFQHANRLYQKGYDVELLSLNATNDSDWFPNQRVKVVPYVQTRKILQNGDTDILFATSYSTAFSVTLAKARRKVYFVQSDESRFFQKDPDLCKKIRETYRLPLEYVTEAKWIQQWLKEEFGHESYYVPNGLDPVMFHKTEPLEPKGNKLRVLIEGSIDVPFKGMEDAYAAVKDLDAELWIVSNQGKPKPGWRYDRFFQNVPIDEMKKIYSSCDIFLKMSRVEGFFGPPMEAMACGCAVVVAKVTGYDEYIRGGVNALVVDSRDTKGARESILKLMNDKTLRERLVENGYQTAKEWSWERSVMAMEWVLRDHEKPK